MLPVRLADFGVTPEQKITLVRNAEDFGTIVPATVAVRLPRIAARRSLPPSVRVRVRL